MIVHIENVWNLQLFQIKLMKKVILFVLFAFCSTMMLAQTITVKGTVIGAEDGMPVIGAYVLQQGTNNGTSTDVDGNYAIEVPKELRDQIPENLRGKACICKECVMNYKEKSSQ
mgnify:CR=1 FL=1